MPPCCRLLYILTYILKGLSGRGRDWEERKRERKQNEIGKYPGDVMLSAIF